MAPCVSPPCVSENKDSVDRFHSDKEPIYTSLIPTLKTIYPGTICSWRKQQQQQKKEI